MNPLKLALIILFIIPAFLGTCMALAQEDDVDDYLRDQRRASEQRSIMREQQWEESTRRNSTTFITTFDDDGPTVIQTLGGDNDTTICWTLDGVLICQ
jgi:hypothetical protein